MRGKQVKIHLTFGQSFKMFRLPTDLYSLRKQLQLNKATDQHSESQAQGRGDSIRTDGQEWCWRETRTSALRMGNTFFSFFPCSCCCLKASLSRSKDDKAGMTPARQLQRPSTSREEAGEQKHTPSSPPGFTIGNISLHLSHFCFSLCFKGLMPRTSLGSCRNQLAEG